MKEMNNITIVLTAIVFSLDMKLISVVGVKIDYRENNMEIAFALGFIIGYQLGRFYET